MTNTSVALTIIFLFRRALLCGLLAAMLGPVAMQAATIVVNTNTDPAGFNPAITVAALGATVTLRDAVNAANNSNGTNVIQFDPSLAGQTIDLAQVGDASTGNSGLRVSSTLSVVAPAGGLIIERSGSIGTLRLFFVNTNGSLTLNGFTLQNGTATYGGAIYNKGAVDCTNIFFFFNNANSRGSGGAVFNTGTAVFSAEYTHFQGNEAESVGGGIYNDSTSSNALSLANCLINNNFAIGYVVGGNTFRSDGRAGAIYNAGSAVIARTEFGGNDANYDGGAIQNTSTGVMVVSNSFLTLNAQNAFTVQAYALYGGAIRNFGALTVFGCTFDSNSANNRGGAISSGGASAIARIVDCAFHGNSANYGAEIATDSGSQVQVYNCTMAEGSGFYAIWTESSSVLTIVNSILWDNFLPYGSYGGSTIQSNNLAHLYSPDPQLLTYSFGYGGPPLGLNNNTLPMYGIPATSPAIHAGVSIPGVTTDQRGYPILGAPDIGAFEYQGVTITSPSQATFLAGLNNSFSITTTGAPPAIALYLSGDLPSGVTFNSTGTLSGIPADGTGSSYPLTLIASNGATANFSQNFTLTVLERYTFAAHPNFNTNGLGWALNGDSVNGGPNIANNTFTLTDGTGGENRSAWFRYPLYVGAFQASFTYQDIGGGGADGTAFVIQNSPQGTAAIGGGGGGLGYGTILNSVAVLLNIYAGSPGGTGWMLGTNGVCAYDLSGQLSGRSYQSAAPVNLAGGNPIQVSLRYTGGMLWLSLTDTVTSATFQTNLPVDVTSFAGTNEAYVGFTGSEGGVFSHQTVSNFSYTPLPTLTASASGPNTLTLAWPGAISGYTLQSSPTLNNPSWSAVAATITPTNGLNQIVLPSGTGTQFYRLVLP